MGHSMPWVVLCRGSFCAVGRSELRPFWAWVVLSLGSFWAWAIPWWAVPWWAVLSLDHFVMGRFVCAPLVQKKSSFLFGPRGLKLLMSLLQYSMGQGGGRGEGNLESREGSWYQARDQSGWGYATMSKTSTFQVSGVFLSTFSCNELCPE